MSYFAIVYNNKGQHMTFIILVNYQRMVTSIKKMIGLPRQVIKDILPRYRVGKDCVNVIFYFFATSNCNTIILVFEIIIMCLITSIWTPIFKNDT